MVEIVYQTRFSYFGKSGWRSPASTDPGLLFAPERLEKRLELFGVITLPALASQTDPGFRHAVLTSDLMPEVYRDRLIAMCKAALGGRCRVMVRKAGSAGVEFRRNVRGSHAAETPVAQVVLDDDDALSLDFNAALRAEIDAALTLPAFADKPFFVSYPDGVTMDLSGDVPRFSARSVPFTNLGLALVAPAASPYNPFMTAHKKVNRRFATRTITDLQPYYVRTVHGLNDSRAIKGETHLDATGCAALLPRFPALKDFIDRAMG